MDLSEQIKKVKTADNVFYGQTVVIASGANPRELGITKESELIGSGVHYCAHCDGRFYKDKTVVVVGGGNSAVTDALYLSRLAKKVYLIHRRDKLRATKIYYEALLKAENIEIVWNSMVVELLADERVNDIKIKNATPEGIAFFMVGVKRLELPTSCSQTHFLMFCIVQNPSKPCFLVHSKCYLKR